MARFPKPFFRPSRQLWYVQLHGKQINLGPDRAAALQRYHELMKRPLQVSRTSADGVVSLLDAFLEWNKLHRAPRTYDWYVERLQPFAKFIPAGLLVSQLRPFHVVQWVDSKSTWNNSMKRGATSAVQRVYNWALKMGMIESNPIARVEKPKYGRRENVITEAQYAELLKWVRDDQFHDLLTFCWETGVRPKEICRVEVRHVETAKERWVFPIEESKGKKRIRIVYLTPKAVEICDRLCGVHPTGPIFRNADGLPWCASSTNCRFRRLRKHIGRKIALYDFRHSFAQRLLEKGIDPLTVATLLGHADTSMLAKVYSHLTTNSDHLRQQLARGVS